jgi:hypothetical protein
VALFVGFEMSQQSASEPSTPFALPSPHGRIGVYLTSHGVTKPGVLEDLLHATKEGKLNAVVINVKNMHGEITYDSAVPLAKTIGAVTRRLDLPELLSVLRGNGLYLIARQVVFYDPKLSTYLGSADAPWVLPSDPEAVQYNLEIAQEIASLGFDELQFDYIRYPDEGALTPIYEERYRAVNRFLQQARHLLARKVHLSADIFGRVLWDWNRKRIDPIGQSLEDMATSVDLFSPMLYPSHYREAYYKDDPHRVVSEALSSGKARVDTPFRPFLQVFNRDIPVGMSLEDYISAQVCAACATGADGYLFWHPACDYTALYNVLD